MASKDKTEERYYDYILTYTNTINECSDELEKLCKKKRSGEAKIGKKRYTYFGITNGVTMLNRKNDLEISFSFNKDENNILFSKHRLHNFIESDLNASGLGRDFPSNKNIRAEEYEKMLEKLCMSGIVKRQGEGYIISKEELY
ncbi:MAG: hypothetical protein GY828_06930 [Candidatus Gracilibacteria bacterium]|nr:hypothetical protein [Candidatus Gracilibacteria bacterium]